VTRKDFRLIAETIKLLPSFDLKPLDNWGAHTDAVRFDVVINRFAEALRQTNPRFDRDRFVTACNGKERR
jgi:hypothetical protein